MLKLSANLIHLQNYEVCENTYIRQTHKIKKKVQNDTAQHQKMSLCLKLLTHFVVNKSRVLVFNFSRQLDLPSHKIVFGMFIPSHPKCRKIHHLISITFVLRYSNRGSIKILSHNLINCDEQIGQIVLRYVFCVLYSYVSFLLYK